MNDEFDESLADCRIHLFSAINMIPKLGCALILGSRDHLSTTLFDSCSARGVMKLSCLFPAVNLKGIAHVKSAGMVTTGMKRQRRSFNDNLKCAERQGVLRKRLFECDTAPFWVEPVACRVLSRYSYGVDAQQLVAVDLDSRIRGNSRISGANVNEELRRQVPSTR